MRGSWSSQACWVWVLRPGAQRELLTATVAWAALLLCLEGVRCQAHCGWGLLGPTQQEVKAKIPGGFSLCNEHVTGNTRPGSTGAGRSVPPAPVTTQGLGMCPGQLT